MTIRKLNNRMLLALGLIILIIFVAGCTPRQAAEEEVSPVATEEPVAPSGVWSSTSDCSVCHADQGSSTSDTATLVSLHAKQGKACIDCHSDEVALKTLHDASDSTRPPRRLKVTNVGDENCLGCHSLDGLAAKTVNSTTLTDINDTVVNPHQIPQSESHDTIECVSCHTMHDKSDIELSATKKCASCHHARVYECYTCHE